MVNNNLLFSHIYDKLIKNNDISINYINKVLVSESGLPPVQILNSLELEFFKNFNIDDYGNITPVCKKCKKPLTYLDIKYEAKYCYNCGSEINYPEKVRIKFENVDLIMVSLYDGDPFGKMICNSEESINFNISPFSRDTVFTSLESFEDYDTDFICLHLGNYRVFTTLGYLEKFNLTFTIKLYKDRFCVYLGENFLFTIILNYRYPDMQRFILSTRTAIRHLKDMFIDEPSLNFNIIVSEDILDADNKFIRDFYETFDMLLNRKFEGVKIIEGSDAVKSLCLMFEIDR